MAGDQGGAIFLAAAGSITLARCRVAGNEATSSGGGVFLSASAVAPGPWELRECEFSGNAVRGLAPLGGAVMAVNGQSLASLRCTYQGNEVRGGGFAPRDHTLPLLRTTLAVSTFRLSHQLCASPPQVSRVTATTSDSLEYLVTAVGTRAAGGAVTISGNKLTGAPTNASFTGCSLAGNRAANGGALHANGPVALLLDRCTVYGNSATESGGGIDGQARASGAVAGSALTLDFL